MKIGVILLAVGVLSTSVCGDCDVSGLQCCITEFLTFLSVQNGYDFGVEKITKACTTMGVSFESLEDYEDVCLKVIEDKDFLNSISKTQKVLTDFCSLESTLYKAITEQRTCLLDSSEELKTCANKSSESVHDKSKDTWEKKECCEYKNLKECAVKVAKAKCGKTISEEIMDFVVHTNGLGLEASCQDEFKLCNNSAVTLASIIWMFVLCIYYTLFFILI